MPQTQLKDIVDTAAGAGTFTTLAAAATAQTWVIRLSRRR